MKITHVVDIHSHYFCVSLPEPASSTIHVVSLSGWIKSLDLDVMAQPCISKLEGKLWHLQAASSDDVEGNTSD